MDTSILDSTQKYAASALFALALHHSQLHQCRLENTLPSLHDEPVGVGMGVAAAAFNVSDRFYLWIHEDSGLLFPVLKFMKVDGKAWDGLKETAGSSSQISHHVAAFLKLLSDGGGQNPEFADKELALTKAVDTMVSSMEGRDSSTGKSGGSLDESIYFKKCSDSQQSVKEQPNNACNSQTFEKPVDDARSLSYPRKITVLYELLCACLLGTNEEDKNASGSVKGYDSRHRIALRLLATWLDVKWTKMEAMEMILACSLIDLIKGDVEKRDDSDPWAKWKQGGMIGGAALAGGTALAVSGGVIAPAIAEGLSTVAPTLGSLLPAIGIGGFAAAATAVGSVGGSIAIAASFGAAGAGLCGSKMATRVGNIEDFDFKAIGDNHKKGNLAVGIMVSGLVFEEADYMRPWESLNINLESYALHWEFSNLVALSTAVRDLIASTITSQMMGLGAMMTVLGTIMSALTVPAALIAASDIIDSKWAVALDRSDKAGKLLAEVLLEGHHGNRPVTLIGFSVGARVVFKCLQYLAEAKGDHGGLVERVVLLGAPISLKDENWILARKVVPGRFINAYSTNDWTLGVAFRSNLISQGLAGIQPVDAPGIENVDVTPIIEGHSSYIMMTEHILKQLELDTYYPVWKGEHVETFQGKPSTT